MTAYYFLVLALVTFLGNLLMNPRRHPDLNGWPLLRRIALESLVTTPVFVGITYAIMWFVYGSPS